MFVWKERTCLSTRGLSTLISIVVHTQVSKQRLGGRLINLSTLSTAPMDPWRLLMSLETLMELENMEFGSSCSAA